MLWNQTKASARAAIAVSLPVLFSFLVLVPFTAMLDLLNSRSPQLEVEMPAQIAALFATGTFVITFVSTFRDLRKIGQIDEAREPSFTPTTFATGIYGFTLVGSLWGIYGLKRDGEPTWLLLIPVAFLALAWYGWPRTIQCKESFVSQRSLWLRNKRISYSAIEAISIWHDGTTIVIAPGVSIEHTPYHIDPEMFRYIVSKRSGKPVLPY
ncbi:MAG: hypothetical protein ABI972_21830 [Acidobacteriota bacterium]